MAENLKVYEEKKKAGVPVWLWLLPLLIVLALLAYFLTRHKDAPASTTVVTQPIAGFPDLGTVHFETDKATLTPEDQATLQRAAVAMKDHPEVHLRLEGFTDSTGTVPHNETLSEQRTRSVADYLKGQGIDGSRLTGEGFGPAKPVDNNVTAGGKADNRRVELFSQK